MSDDAQPKRSIAEGGTRCMQDPDRHCLNPEACRAGMPCHPVTRQRACEPEPEVVGMTQTGWVGTGRDWCRTHEAAWPLGTPECLHRHAVAGQCREGDRPVPKRPEDQYTLSKPVLDHNDPEPQPEAYPGDTYSYEVAHEEWAARQAHPLTAKEALARDLNQWWMDTAHEEATAVVDKAVEYGANSLTELGHEMAKLMGRQISDADATEIGCYFYIKGKMGRWSDALMAGRPVSDDTLGDIGVYVRMAQRVRSHGGWPGTPEQERNA